MPDGTSRFSYKGEAIFHYMGCSTFSNFTVLPEIAVAKIREDAPFKTSCYIGCGVTTGVGAVVKTAKVEPGANVVVFGLGGIGLNVIQGARLVGANRIVGVDINPDREEWGRKFGMTDFLNSKGMSREEIVAKIVEITDGGADYTFDATGNTEVMRTALECCHRGWGTSIIIGVAEAGKEIATRPFQLVTGRNWRGTAFGGAKGRTDVPKIVDWYMDGKIAIDPMITHMLKLEEINKGFDLMHAGESIRQRRDLLTVSELFRVMFSQASASLAGWMLKQVQHDEGTGEGKHQSHHGRIERRRALEAILRHAVREGGAPGRQGRLAYRTRARCSW